MRPAMMACRTFCRVASCSASFSGLKCSRDMCYDMRIARVYLNVSGFQQDKQAPAGQAGNPVEDES